MHATVIKHMWNIVALAEMGKQREGILRNLSEAARMPVNEVIKSWYQQGSRVSFPIIGIHVSNNSSYAIYENIFCAFISLQQLLRRERSRKNAVVHTV